MKYLVKNEYICEIEDKYLKLEESRNLHPIFNILYDEIVLKFRFIRLVHLYSTKEEELFKKLKAGDDLEIICNIPFMLSPMIDTDTVKTFSKNHFKVVDMEDDTAVELFREMVLGELV